MPPPTLGGVTSDSLASSERSELCDLLQDLGPDAPTLCEGWDTRDLTAHLVVRESRPDASIGIVVKPLAGWTDKVQAAAARKPFPELVSQVRSGPPRLSVFSLPGADAAANTLEYFVHHEDVRRAQPGWSPRELPSESRSILWKRLRASSKMLFRNATMDVVLDPTDVEDAGPIPDHPGAVVLKGPVAELTMHAHGRSEVVDLEFLGDQSVVDLYLSSARGV
ncbi:MAG: hypothetical protein QG671_2151 [Actinomycetota bacterium]|nr:hypothetical protein [Actinomycetota bacterium]